VFDIVFPNLDKAQASDVWKTQLSKNKEEKGDLDDD